MKPIIDTLKNVGMLTQFIGLRLTCYTNSKMFTWFGEETKSFESFFTIEANILFFHQNFLTLLIMKAWVMPYNIGSPVLALGAKLVK
jgi:hypothetical protein